MKRYPKDKCLEEAHGSGECGEEGGFCDFHSSYETAMACLEYGSPRLRAKAARFIFAADLRYRYRRGV